MFYFRTSLYVYKVGATAEESGRICTQLGKMVLTLIVWSSIKNLPFGPFSPGAPICPTGPTNNNDIFLSDCTNIKNDKNLHSFKNSVFFIFI